MWKEQYLRWAESCEGGFTPRPTTELTWTKWSATDSGVLRDQKGPTSAPMRLRVETATLLDDINELGVNKDLSVNQQFRSPTAEHFASLRGRVASAHESIAGCENVDL